jgi:hypothetical protein
LFTIANVSALPLGSVVLGWNLYACPAVTEVAGWPLIAGGAGVPPGLVTWIANEGSDAVALPSETEITIPAYVPTSALPGLPDSAPLVVSKDAHEGLLVML